MNKRDENRTPEFGIYISYGQIAVFRAGLENPFNDWSEQHVAQGFAWRTGSVSFKTLDEDGESDVYVEVSRTFNVSDDAKRAIAVPFTVPPDGGVEIASITDGQALEVPEGDYSLVFQTGRTERGKMWVLFTFCLSYDPEAKILRADEELDPPEPLLMGAEPA